MNGHPMPSHCGGAKQQHILNAASAVFFAEHGSLVSRVVRSATRKFPRTDRSDLEQVARIALWEARATYDAARGHPFAHYASVCIKHALSRVARSELHQMPGYVASLDELLEQPERDGPGWHFGQVRAAEAASAMPDRAYEDCLLVEIADLVGRLSPQLRAVYFQHLIGGKTQADLARQLRVSQQFIAKLKTELSLRLLEILRDPN